MTSFEDLPVPILEMIMKFLSINSQNSAAEACSKIERLMGKEIARTFVATENVLVRCCEGRKNKYIWIHNKGVEEPHLLYLPAVGWFFLDRRIAIYDYNLLAERFRNLTQLFVGWLNLEILGKVGSWLTLPKLISLRLGGPENEKMSQIIQYSGQEVLNNLSGFISILGRVNYPNLKRFCMSIIFEESLENCMLDSLLTFLTRHQKTLQDLAITMGRTPYRYHQDRIENWRSVPNWEERLGNLALRLQKFIVYFNPYYESQNFLQLVDHISSTQTSLTSHLMLYPRFQTFYTDVLEDNFRTLRYIAISIWIFYTLDARVFEQCTVLKELCLLARPKKLVEFETENYRGEPASSELVNIECLPKTLTAIRIVNFFIETKECLKFTTEFPKLIFLCLIGIGEKDALGFTLEMFSRLIQQGVRTGVYRGFNTKSKLESEGSDDGARMFMNLFSRPGNVSNLVGCGKSKQLGELSLGTFALRQSPFIPAPFDDGETKFKVYVGQKEW